MSGVAVRGRCRLRRLDRGLAARGGQLVSARDGGSAEVYRTDDAADVLTDTGVPASAEQVGSLGLTTDPTTGPAAAYRVTSAWELATPGFYTAVWSVRADEQADDVAAALPPGYAWSEPFGEPSQITMRADVSSLAEGTVTTGDTMSDKIVVSGPLPPGGLIVTSSVYRAREGVDASASCTEEDHVWTSDPHTMSAAGEHVVTSPPVDQPGTYYWQERAVDTAGELVHLGACGVSPETTRVIPAESASPPAADAPRRLAATGSFGAGSRALAGGAIALLTAGGTFVVLASRRRRPAGS